MRVILSMLSVRRIGCSVWKSEIVVITSVVSFFAADQADAKASYDLHDTEGFFSKGPTPLLGPSRPVYKAEHVISLGKIV